MSETAVQTAEPEDQASDPGLAELEGRARRMGWRPREEFRGDPDRWIPAEEFIDRGERMLPLLQERNRAADRQITELRQRVEEQGQTLNSMLQSARRAEQVGYRRAMQELSQQRQRAVETGDTAAFAAVEQAMRELGPEPQVPQVPQPPNNGGPQANADPTIVAWVERNPWFKNHRVANVAMIAAMQEAERDNPGASTADHLMEAEDVIRRRFPELFPRRHTNGNGNGAAQPQQRRPLHMETPTDEDDEPMPAQRSAAVARSSDSPPARKPGPRSFEAMPGEVRQQYERQRRMLEGKGEPLTREEFARFYWEQEP